MNSFEVVTHTHAHTHTHTHTHTHLGYPPKYQTDLVDICQVVLIRVVLPYNQAARVIYLAILNEHEQLYSITIIIY